MREWNNPENDYRPLGWVGPVPLYATTVLVFVHVLSMILCTIAMASANQAWLNLFVFSGQDFIRAPWSFVTYAFINGPSIWFAIEMYLLFAFGREVEAFIGRRAFLKLYGVLLLLVPLLLSAAGFVFPASYAGSGALHFAVFIAFVTLYPDVQVLGGIAVKWIGTILFLIYTAQYLAAHRWIELTALWASSAMAFAFIARLRSYQLPLQIPHFRLPRRPGKALRTGPDDPVLEIDPLLEKISKHGMQSLTRAEKRALQRASNQLSRRPK